MPVAVIAGKTYNTVIMPDGKEWMAEYLQDDTAGGLWYQNNPALSHLGRHYNYAELDAFSYPGGWHVPTKAEWDAMVAACGDSPGLAYRLCNSEGWVAGSAIATKAVDTYGLHITPTGKLYARGWFDSNYYAYIWYGPYDDPTYTYITRIYSGNDNVPVDNYVKPIGSGYYAAVRLVRDPLPDVATPALSPSSGYSAGPVTVTINCETAGASFHYTTDGSAPTEASPTCDGGIVLGSWVSPAITLKVLAAASGHNSSTVISATYQFTAQSPMVSLQMQAESGYFFSEFDSKNPRIAGTSGKALFSGALTWELIDSEWPMFLEWWEAKARGVTSFDIYCCTGAAPALHTCQALQSYSVVRDTGIRKVSLPVKILNRPTGLSQDWWWPLEGPPALYPADLPMPQWGFKDEDAGMFLSTSGVSSSSRPVASRGRKLSFSWTGLSGHQFDILVDWWASALGAGRRKFVLTLPGVDEPFLCRLISDPSFAVEGANFSGSMELVATAMHTLDPLPT